MCERDSLVAPFFQRNRKSLGWGFLTFLIGGESGQRGRSLATFFSVLCLASNGLHSSSVYANPTFCRKKDNLFLACCTFTTAIDKPLMQLSKWSLDFKKSFGDRLVTWHTNVLVSQVVLWLNWSNDWSNFCSCSSMSMLSPQGCLEWWEQLPVPALL